MRLVPTGIVKKIVPMTAACVGLESLASSRCPAHLKRSARKRRSWAKIVASISPVRATLCVSQETEQGLCLPVVSKNVPLTLTVAPTRSVVTRSSVRGADALRRQIVSKNVTVTELVSRPLRSVSASTIRIQLVMNDAPPLHNVVPTIPVVHSPHNRASRSVAKNSHLDRQGVCC